MVFVFDALGNIHSKQGHRERARYKLSQYTMVSLRHLKLKRTQVQCRQELKKSNVYLNTYQRENVLQTG